MRERLPAAPARRAVIFLVLAAASWGLGAVISKRALEEIPPLTLLPIQLAVSLGVLAVLMRARGLPLRDPSAAPILGRLGVLNPGFAYALSLIGLVQVSASLSVLLWAAEPILIVLLAAWLLRERIRPGVVALSLVAVVGLVLVIGDPGSGGTPLGIALTLAGVGCCAVYTVAARRWLGTADSTAQVVVAQQAHALGFALVVAALAAVAGSVTGASALATSGVGPPGGVTLTGWASTLGSGVLYYGLAYWLYLTALREIPASSASAAFYLIPIFGIAADAVLLGVRLDAGGWLGVAVVLAAVFGILRWTSRPVPAPGD